MSERGQSIEELYDRHFDAIFRYVLRRVANVAEAEDLTAQTFYKALRGLWRFRWSGGNASAWLYRIATNEVNDHFRRRRVSDSPEARPRIEPSTAVRTELAEAERNLARDRLFLDLHRALRGLPEDDQSLIALRYFEQLPFTDIARIVGGRQGTVTMRAHRALKKLKKELEQRGIDHEEIRGLLDADDPADARGGCIPAGVAP